MMIALAASRLGVLFGSSVDPDAISTPILVIGSFEEGSLDTSKEARNEQIVCPPPLAKKKRLEEDLVGWLFCV